MPGFALRNPHFIIVVLLIASILGATAFARIPIDIFPNLNIKACAVDTIFPGYSPVDIEYAITSVDERFFTLGTGIKYITSRSLYGNSIINVYFHDDVQLDGATADIAVLAMSDLFFLPPHAQPPIVLEYGPETAIPVLLVAVSGPFNETQLMDQARFNVRNFLGTVEGAEAPYPFGGKIPQVMTYITRPDLQARGITPWDVVNALNGQSQVYPSGDAKIGNLDYFVTTDLKIPHPRQLNPVPVKIGANQAPLYYGDVGSGELDAELQYNKVLIDGQPGVYVGVLKQPGANTVAVVRGVEELLPHITGMPAGMKLKAIFSQIDVILDALNSLEREAGSGTILAALMILLFLGSFRSTFVMTLSIPISILAAGFIIYMLGATLNIMTLGGFTLAVGRLIDNSVVVIENINRHLAEGATPEKAALEGANEVSLAVLAATVTTVIVFFPVIFLYGLAKYMFSALALALTLAMFASYGVAMTLVPIYSRRFLRTEEAQRLEAMAHGGAAGEGSRNVFVIFNRYYARFAHAYERALTKALDHKLLLIGTIALIFVASMMLVPRLGTQYFPRVDAGKFIINLRMPTGTRLELTTEAAQHIDKIIRRIIPPEDLDTVVANLGVPPTMTAMYMVNSTEDTGQIFVGLTHEHKGSTFKYMDQVREAIRKEMPEVKIFFSSASIVDAVLNFGSLAAIDAQIIAPMNYSWDYIFKIGQQVRNLLSTVPEVKDAFLQQVGGYPTLHVKIDRVRAARLGVSALDVVNNLITAINNNMMIARNVWINPDFGQLYFLSSQYREQDINSLDSLLDIPVGHGTLNRPWGTGSGHEQSITLRMVADVESTSMPAEADHYNIQRVVDVLVDPTTEDLGGTLSAVKKRLAPLKLPRDISIEYRGSVESMQKSLVSFGYGMILATVLLYLVMVAQFRSFLDPFIIMFAVPMGLVGVVWTLFLTHTTLNIESFMGIIFMIGIVVSNSILFVDFANVRLRAGHPLRQAVVEAARIRMRPILMTALATIMGLIPMALALERGSEASAPLARAAAGGLLVSTIFTLFLVPAVYEFFHARREGKK